jgi:hypothetical protein
LIHKIIIITGDLERIWKEAVEAYIKVVSVTMSTGAEQNHRNFSPDSGTPVRSLNK